MILFDELCLWYAERQNPNYQHEGSLEAPKSASSRPKSGSLAAPKSAGSRPASGKASAGATDGQPDIDVHEFDALEKKIQALVNDHSTLAAEWKSLDFNGNNVVSLAEIDKWVVEHYPQLNHKPALMRAYKVCRQSLLAMPTLTLTCSPTAHHQPRGRRRR